MKNLVIITIFAFLFFSCNFRSKPSNNNQQTTIEALHGYLADGVILDDQRPMADVLSEQEVLIKAADIAVNQGGFYDISYRLENNLALLTAKIETPILLHDPSGEPSVYMLYVVDEERVCLMGAYVRSDENIDKQNFITVSFETPMNRSGYYDGHYITKREVNEYIQHRFFDKNISEPVALHGLRLEDSRHSNSQIFWYFQVEDKSRIAVSDVEEYIIDACVVGNSSLNEHGRNLISDAHPGSPHLKRYRMAKLSKPLNFQYYTRNSSRSIFENSTNTTLMEPIGFTGVPLE